MLELYKKFNMDKDHTMIGLFREIKQKYNPKKIIYPGSYVHITPSLIFSNVTYVDSFRDTNKFFDNKEVIDFVNNKKEYIKKASITFIHQDYTKKLPLEIESFDLILSFFGGFVGQATKKYLKKGGILVCNDSHGDASMASIDSDYELIAVYNKISDDNYSILDSNLDEYLIPKKRLIRRS